MPGVEEGGGVRQRVGRGGMNLEKAVNRGGHSEHGEKTRTSAHFSDHPLGDWEERLKTQAFRRARRVRRG